MDNQIQMFESLVDEAYSLCQNLRQMLHHLFRVNDNDKYKRVESLYLKAMVRYSRRWKTLTLKVLTNSY